jgi:DNA-binding transcriptional LysR family regulator
MMRPNAWSIWLASAGLGATSSARNIALANTALCLQAAADGVGIAMVQQAYVVEDLMMGRVVIPIPHVARTGEGYYLACDTRRREAYPLLQFREWAKQTSIEQRARTRKLFDNRHNHDISPDSRRVPSPHSPGASTPSRT